MIRFGDRSRSRIATLHPKLVILLYELKDYLSAVGYTSVPDFTVICGHRDRDAQNGAFAAGTSKLRWPDSKHNQLPSRAVDIAPYNTGDPGGPINWDNIENFRILGRAAVQIGKQIGIEVRWGGDWDGDGDEGDQRFNDYPHIELLQEE